MKKSINIILWCLVFLLTAAFCLSFLKNNEKETRSGEKSALLNPKYKASINHFIIFDASNALEFHFENNIWTVNLPSEPENKLPADQQQIKNLIEKLSTVRTMYKISDNSDNLSNFGLNTEASFHIIYYKSDDSQNYTDLIFGKNDFSQNFRYFKTGTSSILYEISTDFDSFLNSRIQNWTEGLIISKVLINSDIQSITFKDFVENKSKIINPKNEAFTEYTSKILELRQGGIADKKDNKKTVLSSFNIIFGNLDELELQVYESDRENEYLITEKYKLFSTDKNYEYTSKISSWTYEKLKF